MTLLDLPGTSDIRNQDFVNLSVASCGDSEDELLVDMLFPVWEISEIVPGNYLSLPRAFPFDVPQGYVSTAGRKGPEMIGALFDIFT